MILESILLSFIPGLTIMGVQRWLKDPEHMEKYENEFIKTHQEVEIYKELIPSGFNNDDTQFLLYICAEAQKLGHEDDKQTPAVQHHHIDFKKVSHPPFFVEMIRCSSKFAVIKAPQVQAAYLLRKGSSNPKIPTDIFFFHMKFLYYKRNLTPEEINSRLEMYNAHLNGSHKNEVHHHQKHSSASSSEFASSEEYDFTWLFRDEEDEEKSSPTEELTTVPKPKSEIFSAEEEDLLKSKPSSGPGDDHNQPALFRPVDIETPAEKKDEVETSKLVHERVESESHSPLSKNLETIVEKSYQFEGTLSGERGQRANLEDKVRLLETEGTSETEIKDSEMLPDNLSPMDSVMLGGKNYNLSVKSQVEACIRGEGSEPSPRLTNAELAFGNKKDTLETILAGTFSEESYYKNLMLKLNARSQAATSELERTRTEELYGARWNRSMARHRKRFPSHPDRTSDAGIPIMVL